MPCDTRLGRAQYQMELGVLTRLGDAVIGTGDLDLEHAQGRCGRRHHDRLLLDGSPVLGQDVTGGTRGPDHGVGQPHGVVAHSLHGGEVVRHEKQGGAVGHDLADATEAFLLEIGITNGQDLVDEEDVCFEVGSDREPQANLHSA